MRVKKRQALAVDFADKAIILNPMNAKGYAIRGMIQMASSQGIHAALSVLRKAFQLDPASLGDEPETAQAVSFLVEKTLALGDKPKAGEYLEKLGDLKAFRSEEPLKKTATYRKLLESIDGD
jgi:tetratricopeptide (TPR) repeat protein